MKRAFTLIELLVVIGIIALIAAILFPAFARAKNAAKGAACVSNLHQIGQSMLLYMNDYDDLFPNAIDNSDKAHPEQWDGFPEFKARIPFLPLMQDALQPYLKSKEVFHCPSDSGSLVLDDHFPLSFEGSPSDFATFGSSYLYRTEITFRLETQTSLSVPANINVYFDAAGHWHGGTSRIEPTDDFQTFIDKMRGFRYNTLFADMHVKGETADQLQTAWSTGL